MKVWMSRGWRWWVVSTVAINAGCHPAPEDSEPDGILRTASVHEGFMANLGAACGEAFPGVVTTAPEEDLFFEPGAELVLEFRSCSEDEVRIPVWMGDNGSRTWIFTRTAGGVDLRHDHRHPDGRAEPNTFYGAFVSEPPVAERGPTSGRHEFKRVNPDGMRLGWVVEIVPGERYTYGTQRDGVWRHRFDFDLSTPVSSPGDPWGHPPVGTVAPLHPAQEAFWDHLAGHCGEAFGGQLTMLPEDADAYRGDEALGVHFFSCQEDQIRIAFQADQDRSMTLVITRTTAGLDLRHDRRLENGHPDPNPARTWFGAHTQLPGIPNRQDFLQESDDDVSEGWRIEMYPGQRFTYGIIQNEVWSFRTDFDLTAPIAPPAKPWGHTR